MPVVIHELADVFIGHEGVEDAADEIEKRPGTFDLGAQARGAGQLVMAGEVDRPDVHHRAFGDVEDHPAIAHLVAFFEDHAGEVAAFLFEIILDLEAGPAIERRVQGHAPADARHLIQFFRANVMGVLVDDFLHEGGKFLYLDIDDEPAFAGLVIVDPFRVRLDVAKQARFDQAGSVLVQGGVAEHAAGPGLDVAQNLIGRNGLVAEGNDVGDDVAGALRPAGQRPGRQRQQSQDAQGFAPRWRSAANGDAVHPLHGWSLGSVCLMAGKQGGQCIAKGKTRVKTKRGSGDRGTAENGRIQDVGKPRQAPCDGG